MDKPNTMLPPRTSYLEPKYNKLNMLRIPAMLVCIAMFVYEHYLGNSFTGMVVMLYATFLLPSVLLTKSVQQKYFFYTQPYVVAFRGFTSVMCVAFLSLWLIATYVYMTNPS
jgi:hypothetical protein